MLNKPLQSSNKDVLNFKPVKFNPNHIIHHGTPDSRLLLEIPAETLTGITSYLDPQSLLQLAIVHRRLAEHIKDDNTWQRAFMCQFMGINPEAEIQDTVRGLLLRRSENTWRNEFITRYKLILRWEKSRNTTVAHTPVHSEIFGIYLMPASLLLTSSIHYGIVARSLPFTGKILSGYIDASGLGLGMGVGNPNAEFSPDVTACALSSDGGTAKVLWGFRQGEVAIMTVPRAMDGSRRPSTGMIRCTRIDEHESMICDATWDDTTPVVATAGNDGRVKLWNANTLACLWTSDQKMKLLAPDAFVKVRLSIRQGIVAAVTRSGDVMLWSNFALQTMDSFDPRNVQTHSLECPSQPAKRDQSNNSTRIQVLPEILALHIDNHASYPTITVLYKDDAVFYRIQLDSTLQLKITTFGDLSFRISSTFPFFSDTSSFVLTGDHLGCVSVYNLTHSRQLATDGSSPVPPVRKFEAYEDGSGITALAWNGVVLVTGSARGTTDIWDGITFERLHNFSSPVPKMRGGRGGNLLHGQNREREPVRQILLGPEKDTLYVAVGDRVMAWKAGPVAHLARGGVRGRNTSGTIGAKKKDPHGTAKYQQQVELHESILESRQLLAEEKARAKKVHGRHREHNAKLMSLGLSEAEALEYVMMLSREEAARSQQGEMYTFDEGVFEADEEQGRSSQGGAHAESSGQRQRSFSSQSSSPPNNLPSPSNPRRSERGEWQVATPRSPSSDPRFESRSWSSASEGSDDAHFPPMIGTPTSSTGTPRTPSTPTTHSARSVTGSPQSVRSAWATPLSTTSRQPSQNATSRSISSSLSPPSIAHNTAPGGGLDDMDDDLRFALELSLAEALSRGEPV